MAGWIDNQSIGYRGVAAVAAVLASSGAVGLALSIWLAWQGYVLVGVQAAALSVILFLGLAFMFARGLREMKYYRRQMAYYSRGSPLRFDEVNAFLRDFLLRSYIEYECSETRAVSSYLSKDREIKAFAVSEGERTLLFGLNDIHGRKAELLRSFQAEASRRFGLEWRTEKASITEIPRITVAPEQTGTDAGKHVLLLEEPAEFFKRRMRPVAVTGWAIVVVGLSCIVYYALGMLTVITLSSVCRLAVFAAGGGCIGAGIVIVRIPNWTRPVRIFSDGILLSYSPGFLNPEPTFHGFDKLTKVITNDGGRLAFTNFVFCDPQKTVMLNPGIPGLAAVMKHIRENYPAAKFERIPPIGSTSGV